MNGEALPPSYNQSTQIVQQPYQPPFNYQQNQPMPYYNNVYNMQQIANGSNNYYIPTPIASTCTNVNVPFNNGFIMSTNMPYGNGSMIPSISTNLSNTNLNNQFFVQPSTSFSYNNIHASQPNVNGYFRNESLPNITDKHSINRYMQSSSNSMCFNDKNTQNVPSHVNPPNTSSNFSNHQFVSSNESVNQKPKEVDEPKLVDEWFDLTSKFLNNQSNKSNQKHSTSRNSQNSTRSQSPKHQNYRKNKYIFMKTTEEMSAEMKKLSKMSIEQIMEYEKKKWNQSVPTDSYYIKDDDSSNVSFGTDSTLDLCNEFENVLGKRASEVNALKPVYNQPRKSNVHVHKHKCSGNNCLDDDSSSSDEDEMSVCPTLKELNRKSSHPDRLHQELWFNELGEMNDGPMCKCSIKSQRSGIRHNIYVGEGPFDPCLPNSNNADKLFHYRITITPPTNFLLKCPTVIEHNKKPFVFEGFSLFSHYPIKTLPTCKVIRFNTNYTILYIEEKIPDNFIVKELQLFYDYLFKDILELVDLDLHAVDNKDGCPQFHFMPRFVRDLSNNSKEVLPMNNVLQYLLNSNKLLFEDSSLHSLKNMSMNEWQNIADEYKGMIVTNPHTKPYSIRVDQLDRDSANESNEKIKNDGYPVIVHFGIRPPQLSYAGNPDYQKGWRDYVKFRHLLANMPKPSYEDKRKLELKERTLQEMRSHNKMKRGVTAAVSSKGFFKTGLMCDIVQHAMLLPVLVCHFRFHKSLEYLEKSLRYTFKNKYLLQLALTHPSYRENFGTNPDHARNTLTNCGIRQPEYGDRRIHYMNTRKRGINTLINIMSRFGKKSEMESNIMHNERLEFLGDAVVEFVSSIHLFNMFPDIEEGGLATFRAAIVQNQHLAVLAKTLKLDDYMLYAHGSDLCHESELKHAMANCFEALMGALFLDAGIEVADRVFGETLYKNSPELLNIWINYPKHPLQQQEPEGDRKWIKTLPLLQKLTSFEDSIGVKFTHIRLLARAFTDRSVGFTNLTLGSNQRLEFLGDTVLQLIASDYLYKYFPEHHEGHLSLLRSSLVNNRTQSVVCDDLGMVSYALYANPKAELKTKDRADLLEAFLGALYIDKGLKHCQAFCNVCFFPRLHDFILKQDWNDPKSKLQQCCLTLRSVDGGEPDIPVYKVIECMGPTNGRRYTVAVYFKGVRLSQANGHSIQRAEMNAANSALQVSKDLFPQLDHQRRAISRSLRHQCSDGEATISDVIKLLESNTPTNESESNMSELELAKRKLQRKLLAVLCTNKSINDEDLDEPNNKKKKLQ